MSRYQHADEFQSYSPSSSPRGRRYILKNLNQRKLKQPATTYHNGYNNNNIDSNREYFDLRTLPSSQGSTTSKTSNHIGTANRIMPTEIVSPKRQSPRKTPREPLVYAVQRNDISAINKTPRKHIDTIEETPQSEMSSPRKGKQQGDANNTKSSFLVVVKRNENGLTPRDEYMATKLYDREIIHLKPSEVRYTHDQITAHFHDGRHILKTFVALLYGRTEIRYGANSVPPIEVMQTDAEGGKLWFVVNGNKRLYIFRRLERCGALPSMQVVARKYDAIEMDKHFLTRNNGRKITITNDANLNAKFGKEVKRWREWKSEQPTDKPTGKAGRGKKKQNTADPNKKGSCCTIS